MPVDPATNQAASPGGRARPGGSLARSLARTRDALLRWFARLVPDEHQHVLVVTVIVGLVCGLVALAFHLAIQLAERLLVGNAIALGGWQGTTLVVLSPAAGGLAAGMLLTWVVPGARGSGIPQVKRAYALGDGRVPFRDALGKFLIGTLQIGSGASLGREGPTVQICAGATTLICRLTALPARSVRRMLPVATAAGIAAAFNAPIAAVTFTIEEIVGTLDHTVLSGVVVAAALASVIERSVLGAHPVIEAPVGLGLDHAASLAGYALLGVLAAGVSIAFTDGLLALRAGFRGLRRVPPWAQPALGGLVTGLLAAAVLAGLGLTGVNGGGYETLGLALQGRLAVGALVALCAAKLVATVFSYSSGGAGGIFMPALFVGAMLGGAVGHLDVALLGHEPRQLGAFALVGMGAVFAGVIRAPITSVLIIFEMTGAYGLILPLMIANVISFMLARRHRPTPIYDALLAQDGIVLPHGATHDPERRVAEASPSARDLARPPAEGELTTGLPEVGPSLTLSELAEALAESGAQTLVVVGESGEVAGVVTREMVAWALLEWHPRRRREMPAHVAPIGNESGPR